MGFFAGGLAFAGFKEFLLGFYGFGCLACLVLKGLL